MPVDGSLVRASFTGTTRSWQRRCEQRLAGIHGDRVPMRYRCARWCADGPLQPPPFIRSRTTPATRAMRCSCGERAVPRSVDRSSCGWPAATAERDVLRFTSDGTAVDIVAAYDAASGRLWSLSSAGGTASPTGGTTRWPRSATSTPATSRTPWRCQAGLHVLLSGGGTTTLAAGRLTVVAASDTPILDRTVEVALTDGAEGCGRANTCRGG